MILLASAGLSCLPGSRLPLPWGVFLGFLWLEQLISPGLIFPVSHILPADFPRHVLPWVAAVSPSPVLGTDSRRKENGKNVMGRMRHYSHFATYSTNEHFTTSTSLFLIFTLKIHKFTLERVCDYTSCVLVEKVLCNSPITFWAHRPYFCKWDHGAYKKKVFLHKGSVYFGSLSLGWFFLLGNIFRQSSENNLTSFLTVSQTEKLFSVCYISHRKEYMSIHYMAEKYQKLFLMYY